MHSGINRILINYGEIALKGRNYSRFKSRLLNNVRHRLTRAGIDWRVASHHDRVFVEVPEGVAQEKLEQALTAAAEVPGTVWITPVAWRGTEQLYPDGGAPDCALIESLVLAEGQARQATRSDESFAIRVNRADKRFPVRTTTLERQLGAAIIRQGKWQRVNLDAPEQIFAVDIYPEGVYVRSERRRGPGGLPVGSAGHVTSLLSGGIDSPVASWLLARRGCSMDFVHFTAHRVSEQDIGENKVVGLARHLSRYSLRSRLYLVPYVHFDAALMTRPASYELMLFRRFMARTAEQLALRNGAGALVTGDSLGQVASQTLENIATHSSSVGMPVLRPLIGLDKQEIVTLARRIGTYEASIEPYKDCCALISRNPRTRSHHGTLSRIERRVFPDYAGLIEASVADALCVALDSGDLVSVTGMAGDSIDNGAGE